MRSIENILKKFTGQDLMDVEIILADILRQPKEFVLTHPEYHLNLIQRWHFKRAIQKYQSGYPVAYITGHKEFFGLDFLVNKHTLIPRPDTELMVENALAVIAKNETIGQSPAILVDVGTGTGCIPITIAKKTTKKQLTILAVDISLGALRVAQTNAKKHGVKINLIHGNLLNPFLNNTALIPPNTELIVTANLPYLTVEQFEKEPSIKKEPRRAFVSDNNNGLKLYEELLKQVQKIQVQKIWIFLEIDPRQADAIEVIIKKYLPEAEIEIKKDLAERDRLVCIH